MPLAIRKAISHLACYKPRNKKEMSAIPEEIIFLEPLCPGIPFLALGSGRAGCAGIPFRTRRTRGARITFRTRRTWGAGITFRTRRTWGAGHALQTHLALGARQ